MNKQKIKQKNSGFSLIEVLVAVGLLSVVSLALLAVLDSTNKGQKRAMNRDNLLNLSNQIRSALTDTALCRQAFIFNIGNTNNFPVAPTIGASFALNRLTVFGRDIVLTNAAVPGTVDVSTPPTSNVTGLRLGIANSSPSATPGFTNWDATLTIPFIAANQAALKDITITFLITTDDTIPTVISSCNAMAGGTTDQIACENIMGGIFDPTRTPNCRLQQTLLSPVQYRDQLTPIPAGSFLAVETPVGSRGISAFGAGARLGLYPTEADFTTTPTNGVGLTIPANNQLQIDASQGILNDGYLHISRNATGPTFAFKLTNTVTALDVFTLERTGRLLSNTTQNTAWNNLGASAAGTDILRVYDNAGTTQVSVDSNGDLGVGPNASVGKLDVRGNAPGPIINWGLAGGVQGTLSAAAGIISLASTAGNAMIVTSAASAAMQAANILTLSSGAAMNVNATGNLSMSSGANASISANNILNLTATNDLNITSNSSTFLTTSSGMTISTQAGSNTLTFSAVDADFSRNINAPTINNVSDRRLKTNIHKMQSVLERLLQVQSYTYVFKNDDKKDLHFGFIAQELQKIYPNLVRENQSGMLSVNYIEVVPLLVEALKESQERNRALESRVDELEITLKNIEKSLKGNAWKNSTHQ